MTTIGEVSVQLSEPLKQTYYFIINYAYEHGGVVPSLRVIAREMSIPWQTIVHRTRVLCDHGLLQKHGYGPSSFYEVVGGQFSINFHSQPYQQIGEQDADNNYDA